MQMWNWKAIDVVNAHVRRREDLLESMRIGLELAKENRVYEGLASKFFQPIASATVSPPAGAGLSARLSAWMTLPSTWFRTPSGLTIRCCVGGTGR